MLSRFEEIYDFYHKLYVLILHSRPKLKYFIGPDTGLIANITKNVYNNTVDALMIVPFLISYILAWLTLSISSPLTKDVIFVYCVYAVTHLLTKLLTAYRGRTNKLQNIK